jgi:hypothetical protein
MRATAAESAGASHAMRRASKRMARHRTLRVDAHHRESAQPAIPARRRRGHRGGLAMTHALGQCACRASSPGVLLYARMAVAAGAFAGPAASAAGQVGKATFFRGADRGGRWSAHGRCRSRRRPSSSYCDTSTAARAWSRPAASPSERPPRGCRRYARGSPAARLRALVVQRRPCRLRATRSMKRRRE